MLDVHQFFSWQQVSSFAGATAVTVVVTRLLRYIEALRRIPDPVLNYLVALLILIEAEYFLPPAPTVREIALCVLNAAGVALAAQGSADLLAKIPHRPEAVD